MTSNVYYNGPRQRLQYGGMSMGTTLGTTMGQKPQMPTTRNTTQVSPSPMMNQGMGNMGKVGMRYGGKKRKY